MFIITIDPDTFPTHLECEGTGSKVHAYTFGEAKIARKTKRGHVGCFHLCAEGNETIADCRAVDIMARF